MTIETKTDGGAAPGDSKAAPAADTTPPAAPQPTEWTQGLDEDTRALVERQKWAGPADALKAYADLDKTALRLPADGVTGEWDGWGKLGRPENPDGYKFTRPELPEGLPYDEAFEGAMRPILHESGILPWQAQKLLDSFAQYQVAQLTAAQTAEADSRRALDASIKSEWGKDASAKTEAARRGAEFFGFKEEELATIERSLGSFAMLHKFALIGEALAEDSIVTGDAPGAVKKDLAKSLYPNNP